MAQKMQIFHTNGEIYSNRHLRMILAPITEIEF